MRPICTVTALLGVTYVRATCSSPKQPCTFSNTSIAQLKNSQNLTGPSFLGYPSTAEPLAPKSPFTPSLSGMHQDGGNSGSLDYDGPAGRNTSVRTYVAQYRVLLWGTDGSLTAGSTNTSNNTTTYSLVIVDPATMEPRASWSPATEGEALNLAYMSLYHDTNTIAVASKQGIIYLVQRTATNLTLVETYNLTSTIFPGELLLNTIFDSGANLWFTTGAVLKQKGYPTAPGDPAANSSTIGYIELNTGAVHTMHLPGQVVENGVAVSGTSVFCVTGPVGTDSTGRFFSLSPSCDGSGNITVNWETTYDAGTDRKPGAWARGSGSTPGLLGDKFVAITDNSDSQLSLRVFSQRGYGGQPKAVCTVPIFARGGGNNDVGLMIHHEPSWADSKKSKFGVAVFNNYNATPLYSPQTDTINSADWNNLTNIVAETVRVDVAEDGTSCDVVWDVPVRIPSVPVLSTKTGLIYGYTQNANLTVGPTPLWEFYMVAVDWRTGEEVFRVRTGAGGTLNDNYLPGTLAPDGSFFQGVASGLVRVRDGLC